MAEKATIKTILDYANFRMIQARIHSFLSGDFSSWNIYQRGHQLSLNFRICNCWVYTITCIRFQIFHIYKKKVCIKVLLIGKSIVQWHPFLFTAEKTWSHWKDKEMKFTIDVMSFFHSPKKDFMVNFSFQAIESACLVFHMF